MSNIVDQIAADLEDREYFTVDLALPASEQCGALNAIAGRLCNRRANHVSPRHRDCEISWTQAMADETATTTLVRVRARFEDILTTRPDHPRAKIMVAALTAEIERRQSLDTRCTIHNTRACTTCSN